jgi:hypothetical protein
MTLSKTTRDHDEIRKWAEARGAVPSEVVGTDTGKEPGILRFQFPDAPNRNDDKLEEISWDEFFEKFDENNLELVYQEKTADGQTSNFNKLIHPESEEHSSRHKESPSGQHKQSHSAQHKESEGGSGRQKGSTKKSTSRKKSAA